MEDVLVERDYIGEYSSGVSVQEVNQLSLLLTGDTQIENKLDDLQHSQLYPLRTVLTLILVQFTIRALILFLIMTIFPHSYLNKPPDPANQLPLNHPTNILLNAFGIVIVGDGVNQVDTKHYVRLYELHRLLQFPILLQKSSLNIFRLDRF